MNREEVFLLARQMKIADDRWEPVGFEKYERTVKEFFNGRSKNEAIDLIVAVEEFARRGEILGPYAMHPLLTEFVKRFGSSAELLVETYITLVAAGGKCLDAAPQYLKRAYESDPQNPHVLWKMFGSHHFTKGIPRPSFPPELKLFPDDMEHEAEVLRRIIRSSPSDKLAPIALEWIEKNKSCYHRSKAVPIDSAQIANLTRPSATRTLRQILEDSGPSRRPDSAATKTNSL